ncbi:hypothetical protein [Sediminitomix flava]|uniref:MORN repeat protein n=1 Tax=Sediminitomix flava TaxID=379075 RepID=A0A315YY19_SEDFL|nr:hypothetical protein [Sediminitomix flava]PWJ34202.1 hypothetical protein BC781_111112 [Sediminitomix flava]
MRHFLLLLFVLFSFQSLAQNQLSGVGIYYDHLGNEISDFFQQGRGQTSAVTIELGGDRLIPSLAYRADGSVDTLFIKSDIYKGLRGFKFSPKNLDRNTLVQEAQKYNSGILKDKKLKAKEYTKIKGLPLNESDSIVVLANYFVQSPKGNQTYSSSEFFYVTYQNEDYNVLQRLNSTLFYLQPKSNPTRIQHISGRGEKLLNSLFFLFKDRHRALKEELNKDKKKLTSSDFPSILKRLSVIDDYVNKKKTYYNLFWEETLDKSKILYSSEITTLTDSLTELTFRDLDDNTLSIQEFKGNGDLTLEGGSSFFYENGTIKDFYKYKNGEVFKYLKFRPNGDKHKLFIKKPSSASSTTPPLLLSKYWKSTGEEINILVQGENLITEYDSIRGQEINYIYKNRILEEVFFTENGKHTHLYHHKLSLKVEANLKNYFTKAKTTYNVSENHVVYFLRLKLGSDFKTISYDFLSPKNDDKETAIKDSYAQFESSPYKKWKGKKKLNYEFILPIAFKSGIPNSIVPRYLLRDNSWMHHMMWDNQNMMMQQMMHQQTMQYIQQVAPTF